MELDTDCTCFDKNGVSPLFIATGFGDLDMVELLLDKKFPVNGSKSLKLNINKQGRDGLTPLNLSVSCRDSVVVSTILRCRDRRNDRRKEYSSDAVHNNDAESCNVIGKCDPQIVQALLEAGADPLIPDNAGDTPLHKAVAKSRDVVVGLLLDAGADPLAKNLKGYHALDVAVDQILVRPSLEYDHETIMSIFFKLVKKAIQVTHAADLQKSQDDLLALSRDVSAVYKHGDHKCERSKFESLLVPLFENYGISTRITSQYKRKKSHAMLIRALCSSISGISEKLRSSVMVLQVVDPMQPSFIHYSNVNATRWF